MVAKLIVWDADRERATRRMLRALDEFEIEGVKTLIPFHKAIMASEQWANAETCRDLIEDRTWLKALAFADGRRRPTTTAPRRSSSDYTVEVSGKRFDVKVRGEARARRRRRAAPTARRAGGGARPPQRGERKGGGGGGGDELASPLQGNIFKVLVEQGATVEEGALICIIEAMKMENEITAHKAGMIATLADHRGRADPGGRPDRRDQVRGRGRVAPRAGRRDHPGERRLRAHGPARDVLPAAAARRRGRPARSSSTPARACGG